MQQLKIIPHVLCPWEEDQGFDGSLPVGQCKKLCPFYKGHDDQVLNCMYHENHPRAHGIPDEPDDPSVFTIPPDEYEITPLPDGKFLLTRKEPATLLERYPDGRVKVRMDNGEEIIVRMDE